MAADPLWINVSAGAPVYSAAELRQAMALGLMYDGRNMGGRQGVRPGGNQLFVSLAVSTITIQPGLACVDPGLSTPQGPYWVAIPVAETQTLQAADATNPRKDIVICRVYDHDEDASGLRLARTEYIAGVAAPSPAEPAVPAGAIKLALIDVPATPGTPVVTDRRPWTVAPGGILPVAAAADITAAVEGRYRDRLDTNVLERDSGSAWQTIADPNTFTDWTALNSPTLTWSAAGGTSQPALGDGVLTLRYKKIGRAVHFNLKLFWGSTTTGGVGGIWQFGGFPAALDRGLADMTVSAGCFDVSQTALHPAVAQLSASGSNSVARLATHTQAGVLGKVFATHPFTWAAGDSLTISGTYWSAA